MRALVTRFGVVVLAGSVLSGSRGNVAHAGPPGPAPASTVRPVAPSVPGFPGPGGFIPYPALPATLPANGYGAQGSFGSSAMLAATGYGGLSWYGPPVGYGYGYGTRNAPYANPLLGYLKGVGNLVPLNAQYGKAIPEDRLGPGPYYPDRLGRIAPGTSRQREQAMALDRGRHDPPLTEILSAGALNDLLGRPSQQQGKGEHGPDIPLDPHRLEGSNLTGQDSRANAALRANEGELQWPLPLTGLEFQDSRRHMDRLLEDAVSRVEFGNPVEAGKLEDLRTELARLNTTLSRHIGTLAPAEYMEARRYLDQLADAVLALEDPNLVQALGAFNAGLAAARTGGDGPRQE
jgi:hypothetical protein